MHIIHRNILAYLFSFSKKGKRFQIGFSLLLLIFLSQSTLQAQSISVTGVSPTAVCAGSTVTVTFTANNQTGNKYDNSTVYTVYLSNASGTNYSQIGSSFSTSNVGYSSGGNASTTGITKTITIPAATVSGTGYKISVGSSGPTFDASAGAGSSTNFSISGEAITRTTPASRNNPGTVTLGATASGDGKINWYANITGGSSVATGTSYTTPVISATTTYYVDATVNGCISSPRTAVTATISALNVSPSILNFGYVANGGTSSVKSYTLSGQYLIGFPANITVTAPTNFQVSLSAGSGFSTSVVVPYSTANLAETTIYVRFQPTASGVVYSGVVTLSGGGGTASVTVNGTSKVLCTSSGNTAYQTSITLVNFNTINNVTTGTKIIGYSDFTSQNTNLKPGSSYPLTVNLNTAGPYTVYSTAFIDWNQNGDFLDAGETINLGTANNTSNGVTSLSPTNIIIPCDAVLGNTRMRISAKWNGYPTSCESGLDFDGEVEDYTLNIVDFFPSTSSAVICSGSTASLVASGAVSGDVYRWYTAGSGGQLLKTSTISTDNSYTTAVLGETTNYWVSILNAGGCESTRTKVTATINPIPSAPGTITGTATQCPGLASQTYSISAVANASTYNWAVPTGWSITAGTGTNSITVTTGSAGQNGNITVSAGNSCGTSAVQTLAVTVSPGTPAPPTPSAGTNATCISISANWAASTNATAYFLDVSTVNTFASFVTGYNNLNIGNVLTTSVTGLTAGTTYYYRVRATNSCGTSASSTTITYATSPAAPVTPGAITGIATQCPALASQTYIISAVANASTYTWTVPSGWSITAGAGTNSITVTTGSAGQNGNITVSAGNSCGTSAVQTLAVTVSPGTPAPPTPSAGTNATCISISANWAASTNATAYFLDVSTVNTFASFVTGYNNLNTGNVLTTSVTGLTAGTTYYYRVRATNSCGTSASSTTITYATSPATPVTPGAITGTATQCPALASQTYIISAVANASTYTWTVPTGWSITAGAGTNSITVTTGSAGQNGNITVSAGNSCGTSAVQTLAVTVSPGTPATPTPSAGTNATCISISANWAASTNATAYFLDVSTVNTFASFVTGYNNLNTGNVLTTSVTGLTAGTTYYYRVRATNSCGTSASSTTITYTTSPATPVTPGAITGTATQCPALASQTYSITAVANASTYTWAVPTGWSITAGAGTNSITVTTGSAGQNGNISVSAGNSCGTSAVQTLAVTVSPASVGGTASSDQTICSGSTPVNITLSGQTGTIQWQSSPDNTIFNNITNATASTLTGSQMGVLTATAYYRAVVTSGVCTAANSNTVTVTVNPASVGGTATSNQTICNGSTPAAITLTGQTGSIQWQSSVDNVTFTNIADATESTLTGFQMNALTATSYYRAVVTNGNCNSVNSNVITIIVTADIRPKITSTTPGSRSGTGPVTLGATASAGVINWYAAQSGGVSLGSGVSYTTTSISYTTNYYVDATSGGCTTVPRTEIIANVITEDAIKALNLGALTLFAGYTVSGAVTNSGTSTVRCNVGSNEGAVDGFGGSTTAGKIYTADATTAQAKIDLLRVYIHLSDLFVTNTTHAAAFGSGETLKAGVYSITGAGSLGGEIILDGEGNTDAAFIIKFEGAFTLGANSKVTLTNGARSCNVFWIAQGAISAGVSCDIKGSLISYPGVVTVPNGDVEGRMLSSSGAINFGPGKLLVPEGPVTIPIKCVNSCNNNILGTAANFALFTSAGAITNAGPSGLIGDIGSDAGAISGFASSTIVGSIEENHTITAQAKIDLQEAYNQLSSMTATNTSHTPAFGSGETLTAGVYTIGGAGSLAGTLTLDAQGDPDALFVFRFTGAFATAAKSKVIFTNGVRRCNVFWVADGAISMGAFSYMKGTLIAHNGANNMGANGNLEGRMLSTAGAIGISTGVIYTNTLCFDEPVNKWNGLIDTDWSMSCNWTQNFVPAADANIIFDDVPLNDCILDQNRSVTDIRNAQSIYGTFLNGHKLTLKGNLMFSGGANIDASVTNSTMQYSGFTKQEISTKEFKNDAVYNLTIDNTVVVNLNTNFTVANTLLVNASKKLSVLPLYQLTALGTITNNAGTSGLVLKSDATGTASLLHNSNNVPATVQRYISGPVEGYHFLSSPVSNQSISGSWLPVGSYGTGNVATGTGYDLYLWDEPSFSFKYKQDASSIGWNSVHPGSNFSVGRGYLYSVQALSPTKEFQGNLNNGTINYPITITATVDPTLVELKGFNLVGNPYPSSVDWQAAAGWDRSKLEVSAGGYNVWVWNPSANNYGVFNSVSLVGTNSISRYLAPMQGYFVKATSNGNLGFDNAARTHTGAGNWFKNSGIKNGVIRIAVQSEDNSGGDEALIQFGYSDSKQGAAKLFSHVVTAPSLYMRSSNKDYSVRYLTDTAENTSVSLEFKAGKDGFYNITFNFDSNEFDYIQLEDRVLKTTTSLKPLSSFRFKTTIKDNASRFVLHFAKTDTIIENELAALVYMDGSQLAVDLKAVDVQTELSVFDITGKLLLRKDLDGSAVHKLDVNLATQLLLVRLKNEKGALNSKVLYDSVK